MTLEEAKNLHSVFKSNLNEKLRKRYKAEEQQITLKNIKLPYKSQKALIKLLNKFSSIISEAKYKRKRNSKYVRS